MLNVIRHGDVTLIKVGDLPKEVTKLKGRRELAFGETTGHAHRIDVGDLFETKNGSLYLRTDRLATVTHEEHKTVTVEPGVYRVVIKRQYSPEGWENVSD